MSGCIGWLLIGISSTFPMRCSAGTRGAWHRDSPSPERASSNLRAHSRSHASCATAGHDRSATAGGPPCRRLWQIASTGIETQANDRARLDQDLVREVARVATTPNVEVSALQAKLRRIVAEQRTHRPKSRAERIRDRLIEGVRPVRTPLRADGRRVCGRQSPDHRHGAAPDAARRRHNSPGTVSAIPQDRTGQCTETRHLETERIPDQHRPGYRHTRPLIPAASARADADPRCRRAPLR